MVTAMGALRNCSQCYQGNGLLTVFIHGVQNKDKATSTKGADPLAQMGLYRTDRGIYLAEWKDGKWVAYADYTLAIPEGDLWFTAPKRIA